MPTRSRTSSGKLAATKLPMGYIAASPLTIGGSASWNEMDA